MNKEIWRIRAWKPVSATAMTVTLAAAVVLGGASAVSPAFAQDTQPEARIRKLEAEIRALQRKVFPGADGKYFSPEITAGAAATAASAVTAQPSASATTALLKRVDELEAQIARLTGQVEQNANRIAQLEARAGIGAAAAAPASAAAAAAPVVATPAVAVPAAASTPAPAAKPVAVAALPTTAPAPAAAAIAAKPVATTVSATRVAAVRAIAKPQTDDPGDDEYSYGFRLWEAKFYPEAQQQLMLFLNKYPRHKRASWGRNLLGRAYLDEGNPKEAAKWFLENYQADKRGERAPDSLLFLAESMKRLKDSKRACIALAEFGDTYAAEAAGRLKGSYDTTRNGLSCS